MSFTELLKQKGAKKLQELNTTASVDDWKETVPEGYDFDAKVDAPKVQCPRCEKMVLEDQIQSHKDSHSSEILDGFLFLGGERNAKNHKELTFRTNIKEILCVSGESTNQFPDEFLYHNYLFRDDETQNISEHFEQIIEKIDQAKQNSHPILVHCVQGISRSASVVIAYCMKTKEMSLKESYEFVKSRRRVISPNVGFIRQLGEYEKFLNPSLEQPTLSVKDVYPDESAILKVSS